MEDRFPMDNRKNIYIVYIYNEEPSRASTSFQLLRYKQKRSRPSSVMLTLSRRHPYSTTSLEEHRAFVDQGHTLLEPTIHNHEVSSILNSEKPLNFGEALKGPNRVNWVKFAFVKYDKKSAFGLLNTPFNRGNLPSTTHFLRFVLAPATNKIIDNIYCYLPQNFANGGHQVKGIDFDQSSSLVLSELTLLLIVSIDAIFHLTIGIVYVTNDSHKTLKDSSNWEIIDCPPH